MSVTLLTPKPGGQLFSGSIVNTNPANDSLRIISAADMAGTFGRQFDATKDVCMAMNADGSANDAHVTGCTWIDGDGLYAVFDRTVSKDIRVNWMLFLAP